MSVIIVKLTNVHKEEQKTLKEYLDHNCWAWEETSKDELLPEPTDECMGKEPEKPKTTEINLTPQAKEKIVCKFVKQ